MAAGPESHRARTSRRALHRREGIGIRVYGDCRCAVHRNTELATDRAQLRSEIEIVGLLAPVVTVTESVAWLDCRAKPRK